MRVNIGEHNLDDAYKFYKTQVNKKGELVVKNPLSSKDFKTVVYAYCKLLREALLQGKTVILPTYLGHLQVSKKPVDLDKLGLDYAAYNTTGVKTFHLNEHSDGYRVRIGWRKSKCFISGKRPYCFQACRAFKRELAQRMKVPNAHTNYLEI